MTDLRKMRQRRGTSSAWSSANPVLLSGEIGVIVDGSGVPTGWKLGDGTTAFNSLPLFRPVTDAQHTFLADLVSTGDATLDRIAVNGASLGAPLTLRSTGVSAGGNAVLLEGEANAERITIHSVGASATAQFQGRSAAGTLASPTATTSGMRLFGLAGSGHDGTNFVTAMAALISINADAAWTANSHPTRITFATTPSGAVASNGGTERMRITPAGDVGIGITAPTTKLQVDGPIRVASFETGSLPSASTVGAGAIAYNSSTNTLTVSNGSGWLNFGAAGSTTDLTTLAAMAGFGAANDREQIYVRSLGTTYEYRDSLTDTADDLIVVTSAGGGNKKFGLPTYLKGQGIDLADLGVDLTGTNDMYSVLLKAVNAAKVRGGMVKFPGHGILRLATATSIDISGVALVGVGKADRNLSDPDASVIQIRQTAVSPFTAGDGTVIDGLSFDYPNQTDSSTPTSYAALIDGSNWRHGGMVNTHVMRAWQCATLGGASGNAKAGSLYFYDNRLYCIDKDFRIRAAPEFIRMSRNHFSQNAFEDFSFPLLSAYTRLNGIGIDVYGASSTAHGSVDGLIVDRTNFIYGKRTAFAVTDGYLNISHVGGLIDYCERWFQCQSGGRVANSVFEGFGWADNDQNSLLTAIELGSTVDAVNSLDIVNTTIINGGGTAVAIINDPAGASHKTTVRISSSAFRDFGGDNLSTDRHGIYCENSKATVIATGVHIKGRSNETAHIGVFASKGKVRLNGCTIENLTYPVWAGGTSEITVKSLDAFDTKTGGANSSGATYFQSETGKVRVENEVATSPETTGTLTNASANKTVNCSGGVTLPNSVFKAGDIIMFDPGTANRTFTRGSGIAMYLNGTDSASATLAANKMGMVYWRSASVAVLSGGFS